MAKSTIDDCRCQLELLDESPRKYAVLQYNPRCTYHKGPDAGYGYDDWGRPNGKHSKRIGTIGAAIVLASAALLAVWSVYRLLSIS